MSRNFSLWMLLGTVVAIGILFFRVVRPFVVPLFFAGVLAVLFRPLYIRTKQFCFGRSRIAAAVVTVAVMAVVLLPLGGILTLAGAQLVQAGREFVSTIDLPEDPQQAQRLIDPNRFPQVAATVKWFRSRMADETVVQLREVTSNALLGVTETLYQRTSALAGNVATFAVGLSVLVLALYYFLADGEWLLAEAKRLSPLDDQDENALLEQFERVCRGVVLGTVVAALIQGALAALGFAVIGIERIWLLAVLTMFFSFIPFLGAASVWLCVTIALLVGQRYGAAVFLGIYGTVVISGADNLIKAYMIHDRAQMHPLVALVTVLGALQLVGLWGIFMGPMSAAFFYALLNILRRRLVDEGAGELKRDEPAAASGGAA